jgi:hypothetical protein
MEAKNYRKITEKSALNSTFSEIYCNIFNYLCGDKKFFRKISARSAKNCPGMAKPKEAGSGPGPRPVLKGILKTETVFFGTEAG